MRNQRKRAVAVNDQKEKIAKAMAKFRKLELEEEARKPHNQPGPNEADGEDWFTRGANVATVPGQKIKIMSEHWTTAAAANDYLRSVLPELHDSQDWYLIKPTGRMNCTLSQTKEMLELPPAPGPDEADRGAVRGRAEGRRDLEEARPGAEHAEVRLSRKGLSLHVAATLHFPPYTCLLPGRKP